MSTQQTIDKLIAQHKLDRRKNYTEFMEVLCTVQKVTQPCTGCNEYPEMTAPPERGEGCKECGYTGKRVNIFPVPVTINSQMLPFN